MNSLSIARRQLRQRIARRKNPPLAIQMTDTGPYQALLADGYIHLDDHPTVIDRRTGNPALAVFVTTAGWFALTASHRGRP